MKKEKIWDGEYVDFGSLLNPVDSQKYHLAFDESNKIAVEPATKPRPVHSIEQWTSAFLIFTAIHAEKFPKDTPKLMKYASVVRDLASKGNFGWKVYCDRLLQNESYVSRATKL